MKSKKYNNILIVGIAFAIFLLMLMDSISTKKISKNKILMDTDVNVTVYGAGRDSEKLNIAVDKAFSEIERVEKLFSRFIAESQISKINNAKGAIVTVCEETALMLDAALRANRVSTGAFDATLGGLINLWNFTGENPGVPEDSVIKEALTHAGSDKIIIKTGEFDNKTTYYVKLSDPETWIDLGGIAKGYAVDRAALVLKESGVVSGLIDAGGDIFVIGSKNGADFKIGIKSPDKDGLIGVINASEMAIVTSGDYERYFVVNGVRYHHILDPETGYPGRKCKSVTIIAKDSTTADAFSTAVFVLGAEKGIELIDTMAEIEALVVDAENKVHLSRNAAKYITFKGNISEDEK